MTDMTTPRLRTTSRWTIQLRHAAWGGALGLVVLTACIPGSARAEDDDDSSNSLINLERRIWNGFVGALGLKSPNDEQIEYRERPPLVVPPSRDLPPPETTGSVARNPAWPDDPDAKRKKEAAKRKKVDSAAYDWNRDQRNLTPSELNPPGSTVRRGSGAGASTSGESNGAPMKPSQLGYFGGLFSWQGFGFGRGEQTEVGTFTQEPPRTSLTAPPTGYQTPSAAQPYGVGKEKIESVTPKADPAVGNVGG